MFYNSKTESINLSDAIIIFQNTRNKPLSKESIASELIGKWQMKLWSLPWLLKQLESKDTFESN